MEEVYFPFESTHKAIEYYNQNNPARARSINLLEPEGSSRRIGEQFSGEHPHDIFVSLVHALEYTLIIHSDPQMHIVFKLYHLHLPKAAPRPSIKEVAKAVGVSPKKVRSWLDKLESTLERELIRRQLVPKLSVPR